MVYPRDGGTYGTNADGSLVPFVAHGYVDAPGQAVLLYEDATGALLGSANANISPEPAGEYASWYAWSIPVSSWTGSAGAAVPAATASATVGGIALPGALLAQNATATTSTTDITISVTVLNALPGISVLAAAGGVPLSAATPVANAQTASAAGTVRVSIGFVVPAATATSSAGNIPISIPLLDAPAATTTASPGEVSLSSVDVTAPTISTFSVPATDTDTSITGISGSATDNVAVTAWIIKDVAGGAAAPTATSGECTQTAGISGGALSSSTLTHTVGATGTRDCYLFVRDAAGNVTRSSVSTVTVSSSIYFVAAGSAGSTPTIPTGTTANDILILVAATDIVAPSGWTKKVGGSGMSVHWRRATGADSPPTIGTNGRIAGYRGCVATGDPFDAAGAIATGTTSATAPSITTLTANAVVLFAAKAYAQNTEEELAAITWSDPGAGPALTRAFATDAAPTFSAELSALWHGLKADAGGTGTETTNVEVVYLDAAVVSAVLLALKPA